MTRNRKARFFVPLLVVVMVAIAAAPALLPTTVFAQSGAEGEQRAESAPDDTERVKDLIKTLESETAREELIADLKLLISASEPDTQDPALEMAEALRIDEAARAWRERYTEFLEARGLDASLVGYLLVSVALLVVILVLLFVVKKLTGLMDCHLRPVMRRFNLNLSRLGFYVYVFRLFGYLIVLLFALVMFPALWGLDLHHWISRDIQLLLVQAVVSTMAIFAIAAFITELCNAAVEVLVKRKLSHQQARMNTMLPIVRNVLFVTLFTLFGLTLLAQLGVNVVPLLAGAGVIGFAIGFGAQTLIKDVINGFIIIIEDLIQVGDVVTVGGNSGLVERITIRKVQLRDLAGVVFTVPFSEISVVANMTKEFSYYLMNVGVAYRENTDEVVALLRQVDEELRGDEQYKDRILEPIEILGVDSFQNSAVIIKARIKTRPLQQWSVGREFNRRMKFIFDEKDVEIPFPHHTVYFGQNKDETAPPMHVDLLTNKKD